MRSAQRTRDQDNQVMEFSRIPWTVLYSSKPVFPLESGANLRQTSCK